MTRRNQKKVFVLFSIVFISLLLYASYDISTRTTFPGSKPQLKERVMDQLGTKEERNALKDSQKIDSLSKKHDN